MYYSLTESGSTLVFLPHDVVSYTPISTETATTITLHATRQCLISRLHRFERAPRVRQSARVVVAWRTICSAPVDQLAVPLQPLRNPILLYEQV